MWSGSALVAGCFWCLAEASQDDVYAEIVPVVQEAKMTDGRFDCAAVLLSGSCSHKMP